MGISFIRLENYQVLYLDSGAQYQSMLLLIGILIVMFGIGGVYYGYNHWGLGDACGIGFCTILLILLICYLLGAFR